MKEYFFEPRGIAYRTNAFQAGRQTLVFIHGLSGSSSAWLPYESLFETKYNLLTFDLRGHGTSRKPLHYEDYELRKAADDLYEVLQSLQIEKCVLVSHSYGTLIALEFLAAHPELVSRAIYLSPTAYLRDTRLFLFTRTATRCLVFLFKLFPFHPVIRGRVDYSTFHQTGDWNPRRIWRDIRITTLRVYMYCLQHAYAKNYDELWRSVRVPALIMHGTGDSIVPVRHAKRLAQDISGAKLVLLTGANHIIVLNNIPEVSEHIEKFVS